MLHPLQHLRTLSRVAPLGPVTAELFFALALLSVIYYSGSAIKVDLIYLAQIAFSLVAAYHFYTKLGFGFLFLSVVALAYADASYYIVIYKLGYSTASQLAFFAAGVPFSFAFIFATAHFARRLRGSILAIFQQPSYFAFLTLVLISSIYFLGIPVAKSIWQGHTTIATATHLVSFFFTVPMIILSFCVILKSKDLPEALTAAGFMLIGWLDWVIQLETLQNGELAFSFYDFFWFFGVVLLAVGSLNLKNVNLHPLKPLDNSFVEAFKKWFLLVTMSITFLFSAIKFANVVDGAALIAVVFNTLMLIAILSGEFLRLKLESFNGMLLSALDEQAKANPIHEISKSVPDEFNDQLIAVIETRMRTRIAQKENQLRAAIQTTQMLAHDIRQPFSMLSMLVQMLEYENMTEDAREKTALAKQEMTRVRQDVEDILSDILEMGSPLKLKKESISLHDLVENAVQSVNRDPSKHVPICNLTDSHLKIQVDIRRMKRVFINLLANAKQSAGPSERIEVSSQRAQGMLRIDVVNSGSFIPLENREKIFEPFFSTREGKGTGLGLFICKKIVTSHSGFIHCDSNDQQTTFSVELPLGDDRQIF